IFRWANKLRTSGAIKNVTTVSVGKRNTEASATLTQGTTGLLTTLQKLAKLQYGTQLPSRSRSIPSISTSA
ncbi:hypothetical protein B0A49_05954, partial [Cryomyces minteri]